MLIILSKYMLASECVCVLPNHVRSSSKTNQGIKSKFYIKIVYFEIKSWVDFNWNRRTNYGGGLQIWTLFFYLDQILQFVFKAWRNYQYKNMLPKLVVGVYARTMRWPYHIFFDVCKIIPQSLINMYFLVLFVFLFCDIKACIRK